MRRPKSLLAILVLFAAAQIPAFDVKASRVQETSTTLPPAVTGVRLSGKRLFVAGENFSDGAIILINGEEVGTRSDPDYPTGMLIAKKGGKQIPPETTAAIAVQNGNGLRSPVFDFFSGLTITLEDSGKTIKIRIGEKFQVFLKKDSLEWTVDVLDPNLIVKLSEEQRVPGAQGVFQAVRAGTTKLSGIGEFPCSRSKPPCLLPSLGFEVTFIIE